MYPSTDKLLKRVITETVKENATYKQNATNYTEVSSRSSYLVKFTTQIKHHKVQINKPHD